MIWLLLAALGFITIAYCLGYVRRDEEFHAAARAGEAKETAARGILRVGVNAEGRTMVEIDIRETVRIDGVRVHVRSTWSAPLAEIEDAARLLALAQERQAQR